MEMNKPRVEMLTNQLMTRACRTYVKITSLNPIKRETEEIERETILRMMMKMVPNRRIRGQIHQLEATIILEGVINTVS